PQGRYRRVLRSGTMELPPFPTLRGANLMKYPVRTLLAAAAAAATITFGLVPAAGAAPSPGIDREVPASPGTSQDPVEKPSGGTRVDKAAHARLCSDLMLMFDGALADVNNAKTPAQEQAALDMAQRINDDSVKAGC
ncbi:hypothetical protein, partial [Nocardia sp. NPDC058497]|uniref:hypothetical protein n=1 Tax=Nocardia sp. NPDC058497 TaxID=3346529 RepID=UPI003652E52A